MSIFESVSWIFGMKYTLRSEEKSYRILELGVHTLLFKYFKGWGDGKIKIGLSLPCPRDSFLIQLYVKATSHV